MPEITRQNTYLIIGITIISLVFTMFFCQKQKYYSSHPTVQQILVLDTLTGDTFDQLPGSRLERLLMLGRILLDFPNQRFNLNNSQTRYLASRFNQELPIALKEYIDDFYTRDSTWQKNELKKLHLVVDKYSHGKKSDSAGSALSDTNGGMTSAERKEILRGVFERTDSTTRVKASRIIQNGI